VLITWLINRYLVVLNEHFVTQVATRLAPQND